MDYDAFKGTFGKVVRANRIKHDQSQEALAYRAGLSPSYLGGLERGTRNASLTSLLRVSRALEMPLSRLIAEAEELAARQGAPG